MKYCVSGMRRYSWILLFCVIFASLLGFALTQLLPTAYQVHAEMNVRSDALIPGSPFPGSTTDSIVRANDYASEIRSRSVMDAVYRSDPQLHKHGYTSDDMLRSVTTSVATNQAVITITMLAPHPEDAILIVNDVSQGFERYHHMQLQQQLDGARAGIVNQIKSDQQQKDRLTAKILGDGNAVDPNMAIWMSDRNALTQTMSDLQIQLSALPSNIQSDVYVIQQAKPADVVASPGAWAFVVTTISIGLCVGILTMLLVIFLGSRRIRDGDQVRDQLGLAYIGGLSHSGKIMNNPARATSMKSAQELADICASLRLTHVLPGSWQAPQGSVLLVSSVQASEGKTTVVAALAAAAARGGQKVLVIDGNLRQPAINQVFHIDEVRFGLSSLLKVPSEENIDAAVQYSNIPDIWLLPAGYAIGEPVVLLEQRLPDILAYVRKKADLVIIDGPALCKGADASVLASMVDGIALIVDVRSSKLHTLLRTKDMLRSLTNTPIGVVLNHLPLQHLNHYYAAAAPGSSVPSLLARRLEPSPVQAQANTENSDNMSEPSPSVPAVATMLSALPRIPTTPQVISRKGLKNPRLQPLAQHLSQVPVQPRQDNESPADIASWQRI